MTDLPRYRRPGATHREDANRSGGSGATHREHDPGDAVGRGDASLLPRDLADSYRVVRRTAPAGGEATLFEVEPRAGGDRRMLKLYHEDIRLRPEALERVHSIDSAHVVGLVDFGQLGDGRWYEVQEFIEGGNLVEFRRRLGGAPAERVLVHILTQVSDAIAALHVAGLAHHDIKPENILVRCEAPLDLVLSDFGLTVVADSRTYYATNRNATINYQAPETMRQIGGEPRDYWALGLTMATLASGDVPYAGLNEHAILDQHHKRIPPPLVESLPDGRLKQLCRGLTRYDPAKRWAIGEIRSWLGRDTPDVAVESQGVASGVAFNRRSFTNPSDLAAELLANWSLAAALVGISNRRQQFMDELIRIFGTDVLGELDGRWQAQPPRRDNVDVAITELVVALDPNLDPGIDDRVPTPRSLAAAALSDSESDRRFVENLRRQQILQAWGNSPKFAELGEIDRRWRQELRRAGEIISRVRAADSSVVVPPLEEWARMLLAGVARPELLVGLQRKGRLDGLAGRFMPEWYRRLRVAGDDGGVAGIVASVLLAGEADRIRRLDEAHAARTRLTRRFERWGRVSRWLSVLAFVAAGVFEGLAGARLPFVSVLSLWPFLSTASQVLIGFCMASALIWFAARSPQHGAFGWTVAIAITATSVAVPLTNQLSVYRYVVPLWALGLVLLRQWKIAPSPGRGHAPLAEYPGSGVEADHWFEFLLTLVVTLAIWAAWIAWLVLVSLWEMVLRLGDMAMLRERSTRMDMSPRYRRRTELCGILGVAAVTYWYVAGASGQSIATRVLDVRLGANPDAFAGWAAIAYGLAAASGLWWAVLSFRARHSDDFPTDRPSGTP